MLGIAITWCTGSDLANRANMLLVYFLSVFIQVMCLLEQGWCHGCGKSKRTGGKMFCDPCLGK